MSRAYIKCIPLANLDLERAGEVGSEEQKGHRNGTKQTCCDTLFRTRWRTDVTQQHALGKRFSDDTLVQHAGGRNRFWNCPKTILFCPKTVLFSTCGRIGGRIRKSDLPKTCCNDVLSESRWRRTCCRTTFGGRCETTWVATRATIVKKNERVPQATCLRALVNCRLLARLQPRTGRRLDLGSWF